MRAFFVPFVAIALACPAFAATHAVLPGGSIQAKVDLAQPGDIVAIFGGTYPGDVTINKSIRIVEVDGQDVTITGSVTWSGVTNALPFERFTVGSSSKGMTVQDTTGLVLRNIDATQGTGLVINGNSKVSALDCSFSSIVQNTGFLSILKTLLTGDFSSGASAFETIAVRSTFRDINCSSRKSHFSYSSMRRFSSSTSAGRVILVGCNVDTGSLDPKGYSHAAVDVLGSSNIIQIFNNSIIGPPYGAPAHFHPTIFSYGNGMRILGSSNSIIISNNYILLRDRGDVDYNWLSQQSWFVDGDGIKVNQNGSMLFNNIVAGCNSAVRAPSISTILSNCFYNCRNSVRGGGGALGTVTGDPLLSSGTPTGLLAASPCKDAGIADPVFNDLDGTRNDIGPSGGCIFDPEGWTTNKPVVISYDLAPQQLLKGVDTTVNLSNGQAVSQP